MGLPEFSNAPLKKRHSWRPRSLEEEDSAEVSLLLGKIKALTQGRGLFMENPFNGFVRRNSSFSPLYSSARILARAAGVFGPFRP